MKNPFEKLERKYEKMKAQRDKARAEVQRLRTIEVTIEPSAKYEVKEMHIDCEKKDFEVGKWYKSDYGITARFEGQENGMGYYYLDWGDNWYMQDIENWRLATPEEVKEVLTRRYKELGLFDGEFTGFIDYCEEDDKLWIGGNLAYEKGKFAKLLDKKTK